MKPIPKDWMPDSRVYQKADRIGMDPEWVKKQLQKFIETTQDKGQSLNQHFMNWLRQKYATRPKRSPKPPASEMWESPDDIKKTDRKTADEHIAKIRESVLHIKPAKTLTKRDDNRNIIEVANGTAAVTFLTPDKMFYLKDLGVKSKRNQNPK